MRLKAFFWIYKLWWAAAYTLVVVGAAVSLWNLAHGRYAGVQPWEMVCNSLLVTIAVIARVVQRMTAPSAPYEDLEPADAG